MGLPETVDFARNFSVLVRVQGPDPKGLKMRKHAFHQYHSGKTTLSASGMLLPDILYNTEVAKCIWDSDSGQNLMLVMSVASVVEPFLTIQHRENLAQGLPELIPGAQIDIMVEENMGVNLDKGTCHWCTARLLKMVDVPISSLALQSLVEASSGSQEHGWEVGWSLASTHQPSMNNTQTQIEYDNKLLMERQTLVEGKLSNPSLMARSTTRIAILGVNLHLNGLPKIGTSPLNKRGEFLLAMGSPFGILSPVHFFNSISVGSVANCYPPKSCDRALLLADIRCLPGMEGGPVFGDQNTLVGILIRPLRQKNSDAEIQLVIPWEAIASACSDLLLKEPQIAEKGIHINKGNLNAVGNGLLSNRNGSNGLCCYNYDHPNSCCPALLSIEKAMASICLITIDDGVWASGVVLNDQGLILTNAHLLEPWRFGTTVRSGTKNGVTFFPPEESASPDGEGFDRYQKNSMQPFPLKIVNSSVADEQKRYKLESLYHGHRSVHVRLDHLEPWIWCEAKVLYICKGPLDVALLQLDCIPDKLSPIMVDFAQPSLGSNAYVIGHGLLAPRCGFSPSVCSGVVAKVVKAETPLYYKSALPGVSQFPAMLETTAAVHPGGSGGAVVNSDGRLIGLVTSNARHGGGTVIPHLNFSIPSAVLMPIFQFARDMKDFSPLQNLDLPNEHLSSVWALMPPLSPKPGPLPNLPQPLPEDNNNKEGKGSRFAKFIAERSKLLKSSAQSGKVERLPNEILPSKL
ncbi:glyoxysomal processing protease, glyoxysomal [Durio zibethinus]|uniref:Glyoxysomal processing protease, glyoxysomal n=1 Tax=Durio zibethinus TaxID=66656 RepID=A0A6P5WJ78_DURZI|nr:glyoxysomal processing protease, glyoxysomal [Durio zibethinus]